MVIDGCSTKQRRILRTEMEDCIFDLKIVAKYNGDRETDVWATWRGMPAAGRVGEGCVGIFKINSLSCPYGTPVKYFRQMRRVSPEIRRYHCNQ